jgi:hypothetical protein
VLVHAPSHRAHVCVASLPQVLLLYELGMRAPDFQRLTASKRKIFQIGIVSMRRKLKFLQDTIGLRCVVRVMLHGCANTWPAPLPPVVAEQWAMSHLAAMRS